MKTPKENPRPAQTEPANRAARTEQVQNQIDQDFRLDELDAPNFLMKATHPFAPHLLAYHSLLWKRLLAEVYTEGDPEKIAAAQDIVDQAQETERRFVRFRETNLLLEGNPLDPPPLPAVEQAERVGLIFLMLYAFVREHSVTLKMQRNCAAKIGPYLSVRLGLDPLAVFEGGEQCQKRINAFHDAASQGELFTVAEWKETFGDTDLSQLYALIMGFAAMVAPHNPVIRVHEFFDIVLDVHLPLTLAARNAAPFDLTRLHP